MTDQLLDDTIRDQVQKFFEQLRRPVQILLFSAESACDYCTETRNLMEEVVALSDQLTLSIHDLDTETELAGQFNVDKAPTLVIAGREEDHPIDYGIRFAGIPAGHEFSSLIQALLMVSTRDSALETKTRQVLQQLQQPVHLQVFVTPTCPYCPRAVIVAHQMALESPLVQAEAVEAMEFPELADRFNVGGVPQTTINHGAGTVVGAVPADHLLIEIQQAMISPQTQSFE